MADRLRKGFLIALGVLWLLPIYLILANAPKSTPQYIELSGWQAVGFSELGENLREAWTRGGISEGIFSTALYSIVAPLIAVIIGAAAGFAIVALRLRRGFFWLVVIFAATVFPMQMLLMPLFIGYAEVGLYNTRLGMILVYTVVCVPFAAFVMRNFFSGVAHQIFEAAVMDGATPWRIFWRIYLPMSSSALVAIFILNATLIWNDLILGLTLSQSREIRPVMTALSVLQDTYSGSTMPTVLAGGLIVSVPTVALFLATQRFFTRGLTLGQY